MDVVLSVAILLLVLGIVLSVIPGLPGAVFTLGGLLFYWWQTGEPGAIAFVVLVLIAVTAIVIDYLAGAASARAGGASLTTTLVAGVAGFVLIFVLGPLGFLLGTGGVVFVVEFASNRDVRESARAAFYTTVGIAVSTVFRVLLNVLVLILFLLLVVVL